ncbi:MAG: glycogen debranching enzyme N-terminal domain-containing protein [Marinilabiliaceae bacterium]|nr:glycogen debranching enzyme N-terminal domain-containing protein [Marinilabiliaceae bacterium]
MVYFQLDKSKLINLEYSLFREILRTNRSGSYASTTLVGCNTRKYHGLLVCPIEKFNNERHVLLSNLDVSVIQHDKVFNLGIHKYPGNHYEPKGHKYIRNLEIDSIPKVTYRVGGVVLSYELLMSENEEQVLMRYTLEEAHSATTLRFKPYVAFRSVHQLTRQNLLANTHFDTIENGIKLCLYQDFPDLNLQISKENEYIPFPNWYRDIEYIKEWERGYDFQEDLYVPGYFEIPIEKGESIIFSASTAPVKTGGLKAKFTREAKKRIPRDTLLNNLLNAASQFLLINKGKTELVAGYHWYGSRLRDTLVALPGLFLFQKDLKPFHDVLDTTIAQIETDYLNGTSEELAAKFKDVDVPLWLFHTLQECKTLYDTKNIWATYGELLKKILDYYLNPKIPYIHIQDNGLIDARKQGVPLTWMNAMVQGNPVVPRAGMPVELNALWYNAICFSIYEAGLAKDNAFIKKWKPIAEKVGDAFINAYWNDQRGYLADCIDGHRKDWSIRCNQVFAAAFEFSPLSPEQKKSVIDIVKKELLTPKGLRTLSPSDANFRGVIEHEPFSRDLALHQGCVWPWLFGFFAETYLGLHKRGGLPFIKGIMEGFDEEMYDHCLGTIPEFFTGTPPHKGKGAVSMAWNVAAILKVIHLTEKYS